MFAGTLPDAGFHFHKVTVAQGVRTEQERHVHGNEGGREHLGTALFQLSSLLSLCLSSLLFLSSSSLYPDITTDPQRQAYKKEFDADLREYKHLCAEMDDINDQLNKLSRQLDTLDDTSAKYQVRYTQRSSRVMRQARKTRKLEPKSLFFHF